ncbi:MAG: hypothetical protein ILO43_01475 [Clostridia bacterium]|nr:hypothetical protein [Clostridia bacterium]
MREKLRQLVAQGRLPQACVLESGTAEERLALARELAKALVCRSGDQKPCGQCDACRKAESGNHPDILFVGPENGRKTLSVETVRTMRDGAFILPNESERKVYIIDPADSMQDYAQNALLKILEEPPSYAYFLLLCTSKASLLPTVLSRTAVFSLAPVVGADQSGEELAEARDLSESLANALVSGSETKLLEAASVFEKNYEMLPLTLEQLGLLLRDALDLSAGGENIISGAETCARSLAQRFENPQLLSMVEAVEDISSALNLHANKNLTLSRLVSRLAAGAHKEN